MTRRLGFGDVTTADVSRDIGRVVFLSAVANHAPEVLRSLRDDVLSVFLAAYADTEARAQCPGVFACHLHRYRLIYGDRLSLNANVCGLHGWHTVGRAGTDAEAAFTWYPDLIPLRDALTTWGEGWHLGEEWVYVDALGCLDAWRIVPHWADPAKEPLDWLGLTGGGPCAPIHPPFAFEYPEWEPAWKKRKAYEDAAGAAFKAALATYLDGIEADVQGMKDFTTTTSLTALQKHMEWLVHYQVIGPANYSQLARSIPSDKALSNKTMSAKQVTRAVKSAADLCDLKLRARQVGAPKRKAAGT